MRRFSELHRSIFRFGDFYRDEFIASVAKRVPKGSRILDAGAGPCKYKPLFSHCDYKAQDFMRYEGEEHTYGELDYVGDLASIPVSDESFDCIICTEVFEHIPRPDLAVREFSRILRPGGELIITAPLASGIHMAPYHFYGGFTPFWYERFLAESGFAVESIESNGGFFKHYGQESQRFLTMLTPRAKLKKAIFFPIKFILAFWFRLAMPILCHVLDKLDKDREFTVGYHVRARKV